jgi:REP element-mobilizing transposase RayT
MGEFMHESHDTSVLLYHIVCPAKYRNLAVSEEIDTTIKETCEEISKRYEIQFLEIGTEGDHVHFLVQSIPAYSPAKIVTTLQGIISRNVFRKHPEVKKELWGGEFWGSGYFVNTVSGRENVEAISNYVKTQAAEREYKQIQRKQLELELL